MKAGDNHICHLENNAASITEQPGRNYRKVIRTVGVYIYIRTVGVYGYQHITVLVFAVQIYTRYQVHRSCR